MQNRDDLAGIRINYQKFTLSEGNASPDPFIQFSQWMDEALSYPVKEPTAMALATISPSGFPQNRIVLLKGFDKNGFSFFTNYQSSKGKELEKNNKAALLFFYKEMERQIRVQGTVQKLDDTISAAYFASRPRESQLAAWASEQSTQIANRGVLEERLIKFSQKFTGDVPKPPHWGGYLLTPVGFEFWQGGSNRLHDRITYNNIDGIWQRNRLAP